MTGLRVGLAYGVFYLGWVSGTSPQAPGHPTSICYIGVKQGETCVSKSQLVLVLRLIGCESGASFFNQSKSAVKPNQSKRSITFNTQLKTTLRKL